MCIQKGWACCTEEHTARRTQSISSGTLTNLLLLNWSQDALYCRVRRPSFAAASHCASTTPSFFGPDTTRVQLLLDSPYSNNYNSVNLQQNRQYPVHPCSTMAGTRATQQSQYSSVTPGQQQQYDTWTDCIIHTRLEQSLCSCF